MGQKSTMFDYERYQCVSFDVFNEKSLFTITGTVVINEQHKYTM